MGDFPGALVVKNLPVNVGDMGEAGVSPAREEPLGRARPPAPLLWCVPWRRTPEGPGHTHL